MYSSKALSTLGSRWHAPRANMKHKQTCRIFVSCFCEIPEI